MVQDNGILEITGVKWLKQDDGNAGTVISYCNNYTITLLLNSMAHSIVKV